VGLPRPLLVPGYSVRAPLAVVEDVRDPRVVIPVVVDRELAARRHEQDSEQEAGGEQEGIDGVAGL
jgi:hypothetical protein